MHLLASDFDFKTIGAVERGTCFVSVFTTAHACHHVLAKHDFWLGIVQSTIAHHFACAYGFRVGKIVYVGAAFFSRLEHKHHRACQFLLVFSQDFGCAQEHGGVGIVATGMHYWRFFALVQGLGFAGVSQAGFFSHGQGIHVGAHSHHRARFRAF